MRGPCSTREKRLFSLTTAERVGPYVTLLGGMALERANIQWGEAVLKRLERRAPAVARTDSRR